MEEGERDKRDLHVRAERKPVLFPQMVKQKAKRVGLGRLRKIWNRINSERKGPEPDSDLGNRNGQALRGGKDKKGRRKGRYLLSRVLSKTVKREEGRKAILLRLIVALPPCFSRPRNFYHRFVPALGRGAADKEGRTTLIIGKPSSSTMPQFQVIQRICLLRPVLPEKRKEEED